MKHLLSLLTLSVALAGCDALIGKEVARLPINQLSTEENLVVKETTIDLKKGDEIGVWSEMDIAYEGDVALRFRVEITKDGQPMGMFEIDPTEKSISLTEMRTTIGGKTDWSFTGKNTTYAVDADGKYTFKGVLMASDNSTLKVNKAELVFKK